MAVDKIILGIVVRTTLRDRSLVRQTNHPNAM